MIIRPNSLISVKTNFGFNGLIITEVEIDINHVNFGKNKSKKRSNFNADFVAKVCNKFFSNKFLEDVGLKEFGDEVCRYFKIDSVFENKKYRMVICVCSDKPNTVGVITLYEI